MGSIPIRPATFIMKYRIRCLGGSLLVIKGLNDCCTIERGGDSRPYISSVDGDWTEEELNDAMAYWPGSDASKR